MTAPGGAPPAPPAPPAGAAPDRIPTIGELVDVEPVDTVVRLDGRPGRLGELVLTEDARTALAAISGGRAGGTGAAFFLVGHFGSGKSHLLAALSELAAGPPAGAAATPEPALAAAATGVQAMVPVPVPLVAYRATAQLEDVVLAAAWSALGQPVPPSGADRRAAWGDLLAAVERRGDDGLLLLLDELSEFLRAKQGPALVEDLRFLQFLGEWARESPVVVVAALQESIEEVANVSQRELARIRDRYRTLALSMQHVEDLLRGRLIRLRAGAEPWIERAHERHEAAFPGWGVSRDRLLKSYPLHPATLSVLEGLRFLFSQQRGVVDFACRQLRGDAPAGIAPWHERGFAELLSPDRVYDHFRARLHERIETRRLAETVVPYYERAVIELFDDALDRELALRAVKLLCLLEASPLERPRTAVELASLLLARVSAVDPAANVAYLEQAILAPLAARGAYIVARAGPSRVYSVHLDADAAELALERQAQVRAELSAGDRRIVRTLVERGSSATLPLRILSEVGPARREVVWQNTLRYLVVAPVRLPELTREDVGAFLAQARALGAEACLLVAEPELEPGDLVGAARALVAPGEPVAVWVPSPLLPEARDVAFELHARRVVLDQARLEGRTEAGGLVEFLEQAAAGDEARAREVLQRAYFSGALVLGTPGAGLDLPPLAGLPFEKLVVLLADPLLARLHPLHGDIAPHGELVGERVLRHLVMDVLTSHRITAMAADRGQLGAALRGYLVPLGLYRRRGDAHVLSPDPSRSVAVAEALRAVPDGGDVAATDVVAGLAAGPVGLTEPEALVVLNACVQAGLIEAWRGRRQLTDPFLGVTAADRFRTAELLEPAARAALAGLAPVVGQGPWEPWNATLQQAAWERARAWVEARREEVSQVRAGLAAMGDNPLLASVVAEPAAADIAVVAALTGAVDTGLGAVPGLRQLVVAVGDAEAVLAAARRVGAVARFFREGRARVEQAASYLTHAQLELPDEADRLRLLRAEGERLIRDVLTLAAEDRVHELSDLEREFRRLYVASYKQEHDRFYTGPARQKAAAIRSSGPYRALAALAGTGALAVPDDRVKVDRLINAATPKPCDRSLDLELSWKPVCTCGFVLGLQPATIDAAAIEATATRGVRQALTEIDRPEHRDRLERAVDDLAALGRDEAAADLRRLLAIGADPSSADPVAVAHLLEGALGSVVRDVLAGGQFVVRRDLAVLRDDLAGRRFTKRRLGELLGSWVDAGGDLPAGTFVEVVDGAEPAATASVTAAPDGLRPRGTRTPCATFDLLSGRFPGLAALLPPDRPGEAFWLAAWWGAQVPGAEPPPWLPAGLLADRDLLAVAAEAAASDLAARAELAQLDERIGPDSVLGDQVSAALGLHERTAAGVADLLAGERWLRAPLHWCASDLAGRVAVDWQLVHRLPDLAPARLAASHALVAEAELAPLGLVLEAARHLATLDRRLSDASGCELVEDVYPACIAPVAGLVSRAEVASIGRSVLAPEAVESVRRAADRSLRAAEAAFAAHADAGFPGTMAIWDVGRKVLAPLLRTHSRVAVLLVDAMRADLWLRLQPAVAAALPGRPFHQAWAVVPEPTRTREAVSALNLGRPVPAGSGPDGPEEFGVPFAHLGHEAVAQVGVDRDGAAGALKGLWAAGPPISVAVATGVDEVLHRAATDVATLVEEAAAGLERRVVPTLHALPRDVPLVVLADHGFRENRSWGRAAGSRYAHGGLSLDESVIPVATFGVAD